MGDQSDQRKPSSGPWSYQERLDIEVEGSDRGPQRWVEQALDPDWVAAYRLGLQDGRTVVAELRVLPVRRVETAYTRWRLGLWTESEEDVPVGGLSREVVLKASVRKAREFGHRKRKQAVAVSPFDFGFLERPWRPGRKGYDLKHELGWARAYARLAEGGTKTPIIDLAKLVSEGTGKEVTPDQVRRIIRRVREKGLLGKPGRGARAGSSLTPKATKLLTG